jgi:dynein heavy chain 1
MNSLLASGEVPGLFEGEERTQLLSACRDSFSQRGETMIDSVDIFFEDNYFSKMK